ncbi:hypothetical protein CSQ88_06570 [Iodobacter sp. BJB302]|nr:hypothetical protein CSQ88_06570 [Iodobacter sp. BJB302]
MFFKQGFVATWTNNYNMPRNCLGSTARPLLANEWFAVRLYMENPHTKKLTFIQIVKGGSHLAWGELGCEANDTPLCQDS